MSMKRARRMRNIIYAIFAIGIFCLVISGCSGKRDKPEAADYVFTNGKVYTVNPKQPWAEAVVVDDNKIVYVGDNSGAKAFVGEGTESIDLQGRKIHYQDWVRILALH